MSRESENGQTSEMQNKVSDNDKVNDEKREMMTKDKEMVDDDSSDEGVPIDTGWAWVIAISVHVMLTLTFGFGRVMSVLFVDFTEQFNQSTTVISLMFTVEALSSSIAVLFTTSKIMPRFSIRSICFVTGISTSLVTIFISRAPNIVIFLLLFIAKGFCFQANLVGTLTMIGYYFKKRRALATSIASAGHCMSYIAIAPIAEMLRLQYGARGCLLIIAGIELHLVLFSLLLRPVDSYKKIHAKRVKRQEVERQSTAHNSPVFKTATNDDLADSSATQSKRAIKSSDGTVEEHMQLLSTASDREDATCKEECKARKGHNEEDPASELGHKTTNSSTTDYARTESGSLSPKIRPLNSSSNNKESSQILSSNLKRSGLMGDSQVSHVQDTEDTCSKMADSPLTNAEGEVTGVCTANGGICTSSAVNLTKCHESRNHSRKHNLKKLSTSFGSQLSHLSAISVSHSDVSFVPPGYIADLKDIHDDPNGGNNEKNCSCWLKDIMDFSLFKIWRFRMMSLFQTFGVYTHFLSVYMPTIAFTSGIDKSDAAMLLIMSGVMDLVSRIVMGYIGDYPWISLSKVVAFSMLVIAAVSQFTRFITTYVHFVVFAMVVGGLGGMRQNFTAVLLMEYIGVDKFSKGYAISAMLATLSLSATYPIIGAMVDATGSFVAPLHFIGAILFLVGILLFCEPVFRKLDEKNPAQQKTGRELAE